MQCFAIACSLMVERAQQKAAAAADQDPVEDDSSLDKQEEANSRGPHQVASTAEQGMQDAPSMDDSQPRSAHLPVPAKQPSAAPNLTAAKEAAEVTSAQAAAALYTATSAEGETLSPVCSVHSAKHTRSGSYKILQDTEAAS